MLGQPCLGFGHILLRAMLRKSTHNAMTLSCHTWQSPISPRTHLRIPPTAPPASHSCWPSCSAASSTSCGRCLRASWCPSRWVLPVLGMGAAVQHLLPPTCVPAVSTVRVALHCPACRMQQALGAALQQGLALCCAPAVQVMPAAWKWMNRISPTTWILYGLAGSQLCDRDIPMEVRTTCQTGAGLLDRAGALSRAGVLSRAESPKCTRVVRVLPPPPPVQGFNGPTTVSQFMEDAFGYEQRMVWWCVLIVFAFCLVFRGEHGVWGVGEDGGMSHAHGGSQGNPGWGAGCAASTSHRAVLGWLAPQSSPWWCWPRSTSRSAEGGRAAAKLCARRRVGAGRAMSFTRGTSEIRS